MSKQSIQAKLAHKQRNYTNKMNNRNTSIYRDREANINFLISIVSSKITFQDLPNTHARVSLKQASLL